MTTFFLGEDGKDVTTLFDSTKVWDGESSSSLFISQFSNYEGIYSGLTDAQSVSFKMGNKIFFLNGSEFIYYDGTNAGKVSDIAKIPTIALGKSPDGTGGTPNEAFNRICQKWKVSFNPDGTLTEFQCDIIYKEDGVTPVTLSDNLFKAYIYEEEMTEGSGFTFDRTTWKAKFSVAPGFPNDVDTLQIQLEATDLMDETIISKCTNAIEHGGKNNSVIMLTGNPDYPNTIFYCWVYDPTYWPENYDFNVGGDALPITGWGRMNEYLISYKQPGDQSVQWYSEIDLDNDGDIFYNTYQLNDQYGCVAPRTVSPAQNGLLALSDQGVIWTWPTFIKGQYNCKVVSGNINGRNNIADGLLDNTKEDLENAFATVHNNKYLLHVGSKVWVLDLDYSDLGQSIYCWYPYSGLYANAGGFLRRSDRLYMSDKAIGLLYKEQQPDDDIEHADDGEIIDAWWTSPLLFLGGREWIKKFERINLTFKASHGTEHILYLISDSGIEEVPLSQESGLFDARYFHAEYFNAGSFAPDYPESQSEKIGIKAEYFQFKIRNNILNRGFTMLAAMITFSKNKLVK